MCVHSVRTNRSINWKQRGPTIADGVVALGRSVGARLASVDFVLDYLILGFDEKGALTTLVWPEAFVRGKVLRFGMQGYRDALCDLINQSVCETDISTDENITISFGDNQLRIRLRERKGPGERAILTAPQHFMHVW